MGHQQTKGRALNEQLADSLFAKSRRELYDQERKLGPVTLDFATSLCNTSHQQIVQLIRSQVVAKLQERHVQVSEEGIPVTVCLFTTSRRLWTLDQVQERQGESFRCLLTVLFANVLHLHGEEWMTANRHSNTLCLPYEFPEPGTRSFAQLVLVLVFRIMQILDARQNTIM